MHGDEVKMGETVLSFHIHSGNDTCDGCEPGQVMAHLSKHRREDNTGELLKVKHSHRERNTFFFFLYRFMKQQWACSCCKSCALSQCEITLLSLPLLFSKGPALTKEDKESLRQKELKQMKAKYGLQVSANLGAVISFNPLVFFFFPFCFLMEALISLLFCKQSGDYEETKALKNPKYKDRAESRRQTVGSEGVFQRDDAPASVHE